MFEVSTANEISRTERTKTPVQNPLRESSSTHLRRAMGNQMLGFVLGGGGEAPQSPPVLQPKLEIGSADDPLEHEADRAAGEVLTASTGDAPAMVQLKATPGSAAPSARRTAPAIVHDVLRSPGQPLDPITRAFMEPRFGHDFSGVRVHTGEDAARSAHAMNAAAYTVGRNIVFGSPESTANRSLLAHELSHVVQQSSSDRRSVMRQPADESKNCDPVPPEIASPGPSTSADLKVTPGDLRSGVLGSPIPLPGSLSVSGNVVNPKFPRFDLRVSPGLLTAGILENIDLDVSPRPGTPPYANSRPENQKRITLINPILTFDPSARTLRGHAVLSVGGDYPPQLKGPTEINVDIEATEIGKFSGDLTYGPLDAHFTLKLHYDSDRLENALKQSFNPEGGLSGFRNDLETIISDTFPGIDLSSASAGLHSALQDLLSGKIEGTELAERVVALIARSIPAGASVDCLKQTLRRFASELKHPGFSATGGVRLFGLPLSHFDASAPTTVPLAHPLLNAPAKFPLTTSQYGVILTPPGALSSVSLPAPGASYSSFDRKSGLSATIAALPTLSTSAISAGEGPLKEFPVVSYGEVSYVRRFNQNLELGVRLTVSVSTDLLGGKSAAATTPFNQAIGEYQSYRRATLIPGYDPADLLSPSAASPSDSRDRVRDLNDPTAADKLPPGVDAFPAPLAAISIFGRWGP
jgi:hypothetical protein